MALAKTLWTTIVDLVSTGQNVSDNLDVAFSNLDDAIDQVNTNTLVVENFDNNVGAATELTGILTLDDIVSLNTDISKLDIIAFDYYIQGNKYSYAGGTAISPTIGAGDSSTFIGVDTSGLVYSEEKFTEIQTLTILPIARLQAIQGQSGSGSDLQTPIHLMWTETQEGHEARAWHEGVVGVLYQKGGTYVENSVTPLQVDQLEGAFHNAQRKHIDISANSNIEASSVYHVGGTAFPQTKATLVIPKYWDNETDIVALSANKFVSHTLLRSPKEEDLFFLIYGTQEYDSQSQAEKAKVDYSIFTNQSESSLYAVARFIVKGDSTNIEAIQDERPNIILEDESTGLGDLPPSYAGLYISTPAETTITTQDVFVKEAGTTTEVTSSSDFTLTAAGRFTYTGVATRRFKTDLVSSITSANNNQLIRLRLAINGTTIVESEQSKLGVNTIVGTLPLTFLPELSTDDYVEVYIANGTGATNVTVDNMNMNIISID